MWMECTMGHIVISSVPRCPVCPVVLLCSLLAALLFSLVSSSQPLDVFDTTAFGVSALEAAVLDPQQRLLLEAAADVISTASGSSSRNRSSSGGGGSSSLMGVFVGVSSMDYNKLSLKFTGGVTPYTPTGSSLSVNAGRLCYTYGLSGPGVAVDTACSSSLVAMHAGRQFI